MRALFRGFVLIKYADFLFYAQKRGDGVMFCRQGKKLLKMHDR